MPGRVDAERSPDLWRWRASTALKRRPTKTSELTSEQFRAAVAAAISGVEHLYREVDLLIARLHEELAEEPEPLTLKRGTLGKAGKEDSKRVVVRYEYRRSVRARG